MSSVIRFLETIGGSAELRYAAKPALYKALNEHGVDQDAQWAILRGDAARLGALLGAQSKMNCHNQAPFPTPEMVAAGEQQVRHVA